VYRAPVTAILPTRIETTALLTLYAMIIAILISVPLGVWAAVRRNHVTDHSIRFFTMLTFSMPAFWLGLVLILAFSVHFHLLPAAGYQTGVVGHLRTLTLPALTLALAIAPLMVRVLRASVSESLQADFVQAARARGFARRRILWTHVMRNSLIPFVTVLGATVGGLLGGAAAVETVFALPGVGSLLVSSVNARDYPMIEALTLVFVLAVVIANIVTDLLYVVIDPRVRL
jgi:peptide/nickel transport system permease protein